mgnify:CR=1 FL=1
MRSLTALIAAILLLGSPLSNAALTDGLVAHYTFDGNVLDSSSNENHGTAHGGLTFEAGVLGQAARFDGFSSFVATNSSVGNLGNHATLAFWFQPDPVAFTRPTRVFEKDDRAYWWFTTVSGGQVALSFSLRQTNSYGPPQTTLTVGDPSTMLGNWTHVLIRKDGSIVDFFLNGHLVDSTTTAVTGVATTAPMYFGKSYYWNDFYYAGLVDDARVYDRALNNAEIAQLAMIPEPNGWITLSLGLMALTALRRNRASRAMSAA